MNFQHHLMFFHKFRKPFKNDCQQSCVWVAVSWSDCSHNHALSSWETQDALECCTLSQTEELDYVQCCTKPDDHSSKELCFAQDQLRPPPFSYLNEWPKCTKPNCYSWVESITLLACAVGYKQVGICPRRTLPCSRHVGLATWSALIPGGQRWCLVDGLGLQDTPWRRQA